MKAFPKPLSAKQEREYLIKSAAGDMYARNQLIEHNLRLVAHIVKKYISNEKESEDMLSVGTIGLIKAVDSFDVNKGIKLATYAARCIDNELLMMMRSEKKQAKDVYLYETIGTDKEGNEISLIDVMESKNSDAIDRIELKQDIDSLYKSIRDVLSDREFEIIVRRYGLFGTDEMTQIKIANKMGISRSYVSRIEKKAVEKLYKIFVNT